MVTYFGQLIQIYFEISIEKGFNLDNLDILK